MGISAAPKSGPKLSALARWAGVLAQFGQIRVLSYGLPNTPLVTKMLPPSGFSNDKPTGRRVFRFLDASAHNVRNPPNPEDALSTHKILPANLSPSSLLIAHF